jgi:Tn3 transposase DDE domain
VAFFADALKCVSLIVKPQNLNKIDSLLCPASTTTSQTEDLARSLLTANRAIASGGHFVPYVLSELRDCLRSGDISVVGSRQYQDFEDYLLPQDQWQLLCDNNEIPVAITTDFTTYIEQRQELLFEQFDKVSELLRKNKLPGVVSENEKLVISPVISNMPDGATQFRNRIYNLLPRIKLTDLLIEVDSWTSFTKHFTHLQTGELASDKVILLSTILADAINLGLVKMPEALPSPDLTFERLAWVYDWYIRDETYSKALAEIINFHTKIPFSAYWGDGKTSSSDGQPLRFQLTHPTSY